MERRLDVSGLEPPEPLEQVLASIKELGSGEFLHVEHRMEPMLLYPLLEQMDYRWETRFDPKGMYHIIIWHREDSAAMLKAKSTIEGCCNS